MGVPFPFRGNKIIQPELPVNFLKPKMNGIVVELRLRDPRCGNGCWKSGNICLSISPTTAFLPGCISYQKNHKTSGLVSVVRVSVKCPRSNFKYHSVMRIAFRRASGIMVTLSPIRTMQRRKKVIVDLPGVAVPAERDSSFAREPSSRGRG